MFEEKWWEGQQSVPRPATDSPKQALALPQPTGQWDNTEPTGLSSRGMAKHKNLSLAALLP